MLRTDPVDSSDKSCTGPSSEGATSNNQARRTTPFCSLFAEEKPEIVEIDSADEFTAEEKAQIARIKANARKRRRESERRLLHQRPLRRKHRARHRCRLQPSRRTSATASRRPWGPSWTDWTTATPVSKRSTSASSHLSMPIQYIHPCAYNSVYK